MVTTGMPIRVLSSTVTSPKASYLTPMSIPTPMPILRCSSEGEIKQSTIILAEMSSTGIASIIRIIISVTMPQLALRQPSMMFAGSTKLRVTAQMSHHLKAGQRIECTNIILHGH